MPKHEPLTPKAIGKRIKAKGLQKLKWYCQMCQKQCRDENGFKCHTTSEAHQRQLLLFAENPGRYMDDFSKEFLKDFMYLLKTRFGTRRVHANQVYQEYIKDRHHLHMNSTRWVTLSGLVKWLGKKGLATVDCTEKGWFITYIDRDPETLKQQEQLAKKDKMEKDYGERMEKIIEEQIERGKKLEKVSAAAEVNELKRENEEQKISFTFMKKKPNIVPSKSLSALSKSLITSSSLSSATTAIKITAAAAAATTTKTITANSLSLSASCPDSKRFKKLT